MEKQVSEIPSASNNTRTTSTPPEPEDQGPRKRSAGVYGNVS
jgi:hypothetical protein